MFSRIAKTRPSGEPGRGFLLRKEYLLSLDSISPRLALF